MQRRIIFGGITLHELLIISSKLISRCNYLTLSSNNNITNSTACAGLSKQTTYGTRLYSPKLHSLLLLHFHQHCLSLDLDPSSNTQKSKAKKNKRSKKFLREHQGKKSNVKKLWHQEKVHRAVEELRREREEAAAKKAKENLNTRETADHLWWYHPSWYSGFCMTSWISTHRHYNNEEEVVEEEEELNYEDEELYEDLEQYEDEELDEDEDEEEEESYSSWRSNFQFGSVLSDPIEASHRETLGLSPWAPLTLEDVKHAYRACALKWHPDHHDDSTKAEAEAKFKFCNVAYESLIKKLH
ncbi:hypothetical protein DY000_02035831 [Brassica cretica]|uniref:J domain-containing protein n=1 Tax=Brassica cretica TaxID=69181 RepID=A0ABQ7DMP8_BRACR|nr:hypothetical protein DY000_02035831 [Brassica cretica]